MREGYHANSCFLCEVSQASCIQEDGHNASFPICRAMMAYATMRCKGTQKTSIISTFSVIYVCLDKICLNYAQNINNCFTFDNKEYLSSKEK